MIKGVKVIERFGENGRVTHFVYKNNEGWWLTETFEKASQKDFDDYIKACDEFGLEMEKLQKQIDEKRVKMTPEERARQDEADRVVFERWQDEANTNAYLAGVIIEGEDPDFNPFRKDED